MFQAIGTGDAIHEDQETITTLEGVDHVPRPKGVTGNLILICKIFKTRGLMRVWMGGPGIH